MIHPDFEHAEARDFGETRKRDRHAPMIVVGSSGSVRLAFPREHPPQRFLGAGFADRARHGEDAGSRARPRRGSEVPQCRKHVGHDEQPRVLRKFVPARLEDDGERGTASKRVADEFVAVAVLAEDRKKRLAGREAPAVDRDPADGLRQLAATRSSHRCGHRIDGPQRAIAHATLSSSAAKTAS